MKKLFIIALLALAVPISDAQQVIATRSPAFRASAGGGLASFSDDFNRSDSDTLGSGTWTEMAGDVDIVSNEANAPITFDFTERAAYYSGTACTTSSQYVKVTLGTATGGNGAGVILRHTASGSLYQIQFDDDDNNIYWKYFPTAGGTSVTVQSLFAVTAFAYPVTVGVVVEGTGNSTVVRIWMSPSANAPTSTTSWDGGAATHSMSDDPATAADAGTYLGIGVDNVSGSAATWDNFYGGDVP